MSEVFKSKTIGFPVGFYFNRFFTHLKVAIIRPYGHPWWLFRASINYVAIYKDIFDHPLPPMKIVDTLEKIVDVYDF